MELISHDMLRLLIILVFTDYLLGILSAIRDRRFNSAVNLKGITQKLALLVLIGLVVAVKRFVMDVSIVEQLALQGIIAGVLLTELISIRRNIKRLGLDSILTRWIPEDVQPEESNGGKNKTVQ